LSAIPVPDPRRRRAFVPLQGEAPSAVNPPAGCAFHPRCPYAVAECRASVPTLQAVGAGSTGQAHMAACIRAREISIAAA
jgi:peptide/nickel transport system ATP-binding protein